jgi:hypothetical protein
MERDGVKDANTTCTAKEATQPNLQRQSIDYKKMRGTFFIQFQNCTNMINQLVDGLAKQNNKDKYSRTITPE